MHARLARRHVGADRGPTRGVLCWCCVGEQEQAELEKVDAHIAELKEQLQELDNVRKVVAMLGLRAVLTVFHHMGFRVVDH